MDFVRSLLKDWKWPLVAMTLSALMLAAAHAFETFGGLAPCPLCLRQREVYWALIAMTVTGLVLWRLIPKRRFLVALNVMIGLAFIVGVIVAFYHAGVEWGWWAGPADCGVVAPTETGGRSALDALDAFVPPACDQAAGRFLGLSFAGWNVVASAILAGLAFRFALARPKG